MNPVRNVSLILTLAATLACAPASRRQVLTKAPADSTKQKPGAANSSGGNTPSPILTAQAPATALSASKINGVQVGVKNGSLVVIVGVANSSSGNQLSLTVSPDGKTITPSLPSAVKAGSTNYICNDSTTPAPTSIACTDGDLQFTLAMSNNNNVNMDAHITRVTNTPVSEVITSAGTTTLSGSATQNFGTAEYCKVSLSEAGGTSSPLVGYSANIIATGVKPVHGTKPDDTQVSADGNSVIRVYGIPKKDPTGAPITLMARSTSGPELVRMIDGGQLSYSRSISTDGSNSSLRTLVLSLNLSGQDITSLVPGETSSSASDPTVDNPSGGPSVDNDLSAAAAQGDQTSPHSDSGNTSTAAQNAAAKQLLANANQQQAASDTANDAPATTQAHQKTAKTQAAATASKNTAQSESGTEDKTQSALYVYTPEPDVALETDKPTVSTGVQTQDLASAPAKAFVPVPAASPTMSEKAADYMSKNWPKTTAVLNFLANPFN